jgi:hypothetical protein
MIYRFIIIYKCLLRAATQKQCENSDISRDGKLKRSKGINFYALASTIALYGIS